MNPNLIPWRIEIQLTNRRLVYCKQLMAPHEDRDGNKRFFKIKTWEVIISNGVTKLKVRMNINEVGTPTFTVVQPDTLVYQSVKKGARSIPICDKFSPKVTKHGETEQFYSTKKLRERLAGFGGFPFANQVLAQFIENTPLGD